jgi:uncharacterized protein (TIGR02217 family)
MSNSVFPVLNGLQWDVKRTPYWNTLVQTGASGKEARLAQWTYPLWTWEMSFSKLDAGTAAELQSLAGFYNARQGQFDTFLYTDPDDNAVTDYQFGTGNGTATQFQLRRAMGAFIEPVTDVNVLTNIKKAGVTQTNPTNYTISATGLVTFTAPPANAAALTWTGSYYWRVRFDTDSTEFNNFMAHLWECKSIKLRQVK